jgi:hypothetical protein
VIDELGFDGELRFKRREGEQREHVLTVVSSATDAD